jgi:hypothetical protein
LGEAVRLGIVIGHSFGLGLDDLRKLLLQCPCDMLVILSPRAHQQRLVGHLLRERVLKGVDGFRHRARLVQELGALEGPEALLEDLLGQCGDGAEEG